MNSQELQDQLGTRGAVDFIRTAEVDVEGTAAAVKRRRGARRRKAVIKSMTLNSYERVKEFHKVFGHPVADTPGDIAPDRRALRIELIREELDELRQAVEANDIVAIADALGDLEYVVNGAALEYGINLPAVVTEIHRSNMTKLGADGKPIYREDGKILKGENYEPPRIAAVLGL